MSASDPMPDAWNTRQERGSAWAMRFMVWLSLRLGRRLTRPVLYGIALYFFVMSVGARRASRAYLSRVLDHPPGWRDTFRHILYFCTVVHDRVFFLNDRLDAFEIYMQGTEVLDELANTRGGVLLFGAHMGSFEAMRGEARAGRARKTCVAMFADNAQKIMAALATINPQVAQEVVPLGRLDSMLVLNARLEAGELVGILADRSFGQEERRAIEFLGAPAHFPLGPFRMAAMLRRPVVFMMGVYQGGNRYDVVFEPLADFGNIPAGQRSAELAGCMQRYADLLAKHCRSAPYNWFNFFDFWEAPHEASS